MATAAATSRIPRLTKSIFAAPKISNGCRDCPLVLDRKFSYEELMEILFIEGIPFTIRLNLCDKHKQPRLVDAEGVPIKLFIRPDETVIRPNVYYSPRKVTPQVTRECQCSSQVAAFLGLVCAA